MKKTGNKHIKIIAATMMAVFSLFTTFSAAFAWFLYVRNQGSSTDQFEVATIQTSVLEVSIHDFYGTSTGSNPSYGFNPVPTGYIDFSNPASPATQGNLSITLDEYSLDDPHHPVLLLFKVNGENQSVTAETLYPFVAENKPGAATLDSNHIVATYSALAAKKSGATDGEIFEVTNDENQNGQFLDTSDRKYVTTRYQYVAAEDDFKLVWVDLAMYDNPLSSVIQASSFIFDFTKPFKKEGGSFVVDSSSTALEEKTYNYTENHVVNTGTDTGIWIPVSDFTSSNTESFVTFNGSSHEYQSEINFYSGNVKGHTYVGVVIDYYSTAVEYLSSYYLGHSYLNDGLTFKCDWVTRV